MDQNVCFVNENELNERLKRFCSKAIGWYITSWNALSARRISAITQYKVAHKHCFEIVQNPICWAVQFQIYQFSGQWKNSLWIIKIGIWSQSRIVIELNYTPWAELKFNCIWIIVIHSVSMVIILSFHLIHYICDQVLCLDLILTIKEKNIFSLRLIEQFTGSHWRHHVTRLPCAVCLNLIWIVINLWLNKY